MNITGADGASMTFNNCSFASIAGSDNYYAPEGSVDDKEVPNLSLQDITITDEGMGRYGILSGRGMDITNTAISVANKDILGIRTGNLMLMTDVDISVSNIGNIGIFCAYYVKYNV